MDRRAFVKLATPSARLPLVASAALLLAGALAPADLAAQDAEEARVINWQDAAYGPRGTSTQGPNARTFQLGLDPDNDGPSYFARFPPGAHFDLHWHTHAEYAVVLSGEGTILLGEETHELRPGSYIVIPARVNHAWDVPPGDTEFVILVRRRGPADFNYVDP